MYYPRMGLAYSVFLHSSPWVVVCGRSVCDPVGPGYCLWGLEREKYVRILWVMIVVHQVFVCNILTQIPNIPLSSPKRILTHFFSLQPPQRPIEMNEETHYKPGPYEDSTQRFPHDRTSMLSSILFGFLCEYSYFSSLIFFLVSDIIELFMQILKNLL